MYIKASYIAEVWLEGETQVIRVTIAVAYVYLWKTRSEPIAGTMDFKIMMEISKIKERVQSSKC